MLIGFVNSILNLYPNACGTTTFFNRVFDLKRILLNLDSFIPKRSAKAGGLFRSAARKNQRRHLTDSGC
jgi:hypothetical protein